MPEENQKPMGLQHGLKKLWSTPHITPVKTASVVMFRI
jgi:hypothetical protein